MEINKNYNNWLKWFIGLNDAEGNFQIYPKKRLLKSGKISKINVGYSYHLSMHKRDIEMIKDIQIKLNGIGSIYVYINKPDARLAVNDKQGLLYLIENVFEPNPLLTKNQLIRYQLLKEGLINHINEFKTLEEYNKYKTERLLYITKEMEGKKNIFTELNIDNWIIGFINGEGSFNIKNNKLIFYIEHSDKDALEIIKKRLCFGPNVIKRSERARDIGKIRKEMFQLFISSKKDIENLIVFLDDKNNIPLQGYKNVQYNEWKIGNSL